MLEKRSFEGIIFKKVGRKILKAQLDRVNEAVKYLDSNSVTETNSLIVAASVWVAEQIGLKKIEYRRKNEPRWKRRIEEDIKKLRKDVNILEREWKGELRERKRQKLLQVHEKYRVRRKGLKTVIEKLKQRMIAKSAKTRSFEQRSEQFRKNRILKWIYTELNGGRQRSIVVPNTEESKQFWGNIWSIRKEHNREAEWLKDLKADLEMEHHYQETVIINAEKVRNHCKKMPRWKASGLDGVQGYWIKILTNLH